ncbi:MAG: DNA topoisomerase I [Candidatus Geothermincolia bacterium]
MKLIVTEKNITARRIATILSGGKFTEEGGSRNPVYGFAYDGDDVRCIGLKGHVLKVDFPERYQQWQDVDPAELVHAEIVKSPIQKTLLAAVTKLGREAETVIIATDFDREGELIGVDVINQVRAVNPDVAIRRARFSALTPSEINQAFAELDEPYYDLAAAGEARQDIDLVWGASLTRFISLASTRLGRQFLSVGRVQSPTLALIVDREKDRKAFVPESFWTIRITCEAKGESFQAGHKRERFKEEAEAQEAFRKLGSSGTVTAVSQTERKTEPPIPFNTTGLLAAAGSIGFTPAGAMRVAESLYMNGYISYPRVDNTVYPESMDLRELLSDLSGSPELGGLCRELLSREKLVPTRGKKQSTDHPPIHPTAAVAQDKLAPQDWKLYELVFRRFLATLATPSATLSMRVDMDVSGEPFFSRGTRVLEEGWMKFYPYGRKKDMLLPELVAGDAVSVQDPELTQGETQPPARYSQSKLIEKMEEIGLGTKSTRHSIIEGLYERSYIFGDPITPSETGIAVTEALRKFAGLIVSPEMTAHLEEDMDAIADGRDKPGEVVERSREVLTGVFKTLNERRDQVAEEIRNGIREDKIVGACPNCGENLRIVRSKKTKKRFVGCSNYPDCTTTYPLPQVGGILATNETCPECGSPRIKIITKGKRPWQLCLDSNCPTKQKKETAPAES